MASGSIWRHIVGFAAPLLIGLIFQQLYNTVDSIVVGNFVGKEALAAVGSTTSIINTLIGVFTGFSTGAGVIISQSFGAGDDGRVHRAVHTTMAFMLILAAVFTVLGVLMVTPMLKMMSTPDDVFDEAKAYLTIYFAGVSGLMIYNTGSGILRAVGDSKRPLYFLVFSAFMNTALDILFVISFRMGVEGVALATVISQCASAVLVMAVLMRSNASYKLVLRELRISGPTLRRVLRIGLPTSIQSGLTAFSNVFVQSYINGFGSACMAGWSAYSKIDIFLGVPANATSMAVTTFVGQNVGAKEYKRAERGLYVSIGLTVAVTLVIMVPLMIFARPLTALFNSDEEVLYYGVKFVRVMMPFYVLCCVFNNYAGALRGAGDAAATMTILLFSFVLFRQLYLYIISHTVGTAMAIALGYPVGWLMAAILLAVYYTVRGRKTLLKL
ncbi:MAG: MATE family efflux transporter [Oscillospiraceae bacterium]